LTFVEPDVPASRLVESATEPYWFRSPRSSDDEWARASRAEAPGFAGVYVRADSTLAVLLTERGDEPAVRRYVASMRLATNTPLLSAYAGITSQQVEHDFYQLREWFDSFGALMERDDIEMLDIDEARNRLLVGTLSEAGDEAVKDHARAIGLPESAYAITRVQRSAPRITVQDFHQWLVGGIEVRYGPLWNQVCTLGFRALRMGVPVMVTNSHCSLDNRKLDFGTLTQPTWLLPANEVGYESHDRGDYRCVSSLWPTCRWSDASYFTRNTMRLSGAPYGFIAKTDYNGYFGPGGLTVDGYRTVTQRLSTILVGTWLDKTGRTSGGTTGQITQTCAWFSSQKLFCSDVSNVWSEGGDSGSPMFHWLGDDSVALYGVLWGGPPGQWTVTHSNRLSNIEQDLGSLTNVCAPGFSC
jgi:hypothetical protein